MGDDTVTRLLALGFPAGLLNSMGPLGLVHLLASADAAEAERKRLEGRVGKLEREVREREVAAGLGVSFEDYTLRKVVHHAGT